MREEKLGLYPQLLYPSLDRDIENTIAHRTDEHC